MTAGSIVLAPHTPADAPSIANPRQSRNMACRPRLEPQLNSRRKRRPWRPCGAAAFGVNARESGSRPGFPCGTAYRYPRGMDAVEAMKAAVGPRGWSDDPAVLAPRLVDWRGRKQGVSALMLCPSTTAELAAAMRQYAAAGISHVQLVLDPITVEAIEEFAPVLAELDRG